MKKHIQKASLLILSSLVLTSCDSSGISSSVSETVANALPNLWITLAQLGAFLVMVFVFFRFAFKPIKKKLKERQDYIAKNIHDSEQAKTEAEKSQEIADRNISNSRLEADRIVKEAQKTANESASKILSDATLQANEIRRQGEADAKAKQKEMEQETHDTIVKTAIAASKEILGREINEKDNEAVVNDFLSQMKKDNTEQ